MRNSKTKGFTLIELIIVIAIIGILAAILIPAMLGYLRNSRISRANANAKTVHTAVATALADAATIVGAEPQASGANKKTITISTVAAGITGHTANTPTCQCITWKTYKACWGDLLGDDNFEGGAKAKIDTVSFAALNAGWADTAAGEGAMNLDAPPTATVQKQDAKDGKPIIGYYPLGKEAAAAT